MAFSGSSGSAGSIMQTVRPPLHQKQRQLSSSRYEKMPVPSVYTVYPPPTKQQQQQQQQQLENPLRPEPPLRISCVTETVDPHHHNSQRQLALQREQFKRFHSAWSRYYYGDVVQREFYNRFIREGLKEQMRDSETRRQQQQKDRYRESDSAVAQDEQHVTQERLHQQAKRQFLSQFRDANKAMMEQRQQQQRQQRSQEMLRDRQQLQYNPINWSCSLK